MIFSIAMLITIEKIIKTTNRMHRIIEIVGEIVILIIGIVPVKKKLMNL